MRRRVLLAVVALTTVLASACGSSDRHTTAAATAAPRPCLPPGFGFVPSAIVPSDPNEPPKPGPQSPFALMQQALIRELPCSFTGTEVLGSDQFSMNVRVAPLGETEVAAIARVEAEFPAFHLVGVAARQSFAEADAQIDAIQAVIGGYSAEVGMGIDGVVTGSVYGVPKASVGEVQSRIAEATKDDPVAPIVTVTSDPSRIEFN